MSASELKEYKEAQRVAVRIRMMELDLRLHKKKSTKPKKHSCKDENLSEEVRNRKYDFFTIIKLIQLQRWSKKFVIYLRKLKFLQGKILDFLFFKKFPFLKNLDICVEINKLKITY